VRALAYLTKKICSHVRKAKQQKYPLFCLRGHPRQTRHVSTNLSPRFRSIFTKAFVFDIGPIGILGCHGLLRFCSGLAFIFKIVFIGLPCCRLLRFGQGGCASVRVAGSCHPPPPYAPGAVLPYPCPRSRIEIRETPRNHDIRVFYTDSCCVSQRFTSHTFDISLSPLSDSKPSFAPSSLYRPSFFHPDALTRAFRCFFFFQTSRQSIA